VSAYRLEAYPNTALFRAARPHARSMPEAIVVVVVLVLDFLQLPNRLPAPPPLTTPL
jgi:hypothetical protein